MKKTIALTFLTSLFLGGNAFAAGGGTVKGTLKFHNKLAHYCSNITESLDCTGSKYNESSYDVQLPISHVKIAMRVNGVEVATGSTDVNGNYQMNWYYPGSGSPTSAQIESFLEHKDGKFRIYSTGATSYRIYGNFTASYDWIDEPGNATGTIQNLGTWNWGSSTTPNVKINLYSAAWRTWYYAFSYSGVLVNNFGNLKIVANTTANNSYYTSSSHTVTIGMDDVANRNYQAVYHEMAHAASFKASQGTLKTTNAYNYPYTGTGGGHNYDTPEWSSAGFEEGMADFLGVVGQYWYNAPEARGCIIDSSNEYCETTLSSWRGVRMDDNPTCALTNENRFQRNTTRFLWDYYDSNNEGSDSITGAYWQFFSAINGMADGTDNNETNEPWNSTLLTIDDYDGRALYDLRHMLYDLNGVSSYSLYTAHCSQPGDY